MLYKVNIMLALKDGSIRGTSRVYDVKNEAEARKAAETFYNNQGIPFRITTIKPF